MKSSYGFPQNTLYIFLLKTIFFMLPFTAFGENSACLILVVRQVKSPLAKNKSLF